MEDPQLNKNIANIFANYLKKSFGWNYKAIGPKKELILDEFPDIDEILDSNDGKLLFLQLKRPIEQDKTSVSRKAMKTNRGMGIFSIICELTIEKCENNYLNNEKDLSNTILLLHSDNELLYLIQSDDSIIDKNKFTKSNFKGIYIISPEYNWFKGTEKGTQEEFVLKIKDAFNKA